MTVNKSKVLKTIGWTTVGVGLYLVGLGIKYDSGSSNVNNINVDNNIIDAEFTIINE